jgi:NADH:ubiquinone oxidoreductase subunit E
MCTESGEYSMSIILFTYLSSTTYTLGVGSCLGLLHSAHVCFLPLHYENYLNAALDVHMYKWTARIGRTYEYDSFCIGAMLNATRMIFDNHEHGEMMPVVTGALKAASLAILIVWVIGANCLVFVVLYKNPKLQTVPNLLVGNLAFRLGYLCTVHTFSRHPLQRRSRCYYCTAVQCSQYGLHTKILQPICVFS